MAANPVVPTPVLTLVTEKTSTQTTIHCSGRLVADTCEQLRTAVRELIPSTRLIVLDFGDVNHVDSSALGAIVGLYISAKRSDCRLKVTNLKPRIRELFSMTRLLEILGEHQDMLGYTPD